MAELRGGWLSAGQGVNGRLDLPGKAMTLCLRLRDPSGRWAAGLLSKKAGPVMNYNLFAWDLGRGMELGFELGVRGQPGFAQLRTPLDSLGPTDWHDVVVRRDGARLELFVDGILRDQRSVSVESPEARAGACLIGADPGGQNTFRGLIDHAALWRRALTDDEIRILAGGPDAIQQRREAEQAAREEAGLARGERNRKMKEELENVRRRIAHDPHYPQYHVAPPVGWMNDPHPVYFKGAYHLFYQYSCIPDNPYGGPHSWGHAVSRDLIRWTHYPPALTPQEHGSSADRHIWSGCLVDNEGTGTAIYTIDNIDVWVATSTDDDLARFTRHPANPVVKGPPPGVDIEGGMRDPWVWKEANGWRLVVGSGLKGGKGPVLPLYRSSDLVHWQYVGLLYQGDPKEESTFCECPSFFPLGDRHVLALSHQATWLVGRYEGNRFTPERRGRLDYGQIYVPQFVLDDKGRRILWGWVGGWGADPRTREAQVQAGWCGMQTLPRVVSLGPDGALNFEPAEELRQLRREHRQFQALQLPADAATVLDGIRGAQLEMQVTFEPTETKAFGISLLDGAQRTDILYDAPAKTLRLGGHAAPLPLGEGEPLSLRAFVDRSVVEVFGNRRVCITEPIYPAQPDGLGVALSARGGKAVARQVDIWKVASHWVQPGH